MKAVDKRVDQQMISTVNTLTMINKDILLGLLLIKLLLQLYLLIQSTAVNIHYIPYFHTKHLLLMMSHDGRFN
uniref:Uncharacterized protein n=1 Tax=Anguilla anguilla TaxID=7936 RepID=A0A0E9WXS6_ANGAN